MFPKQQIAILIIALSGCTSAVDPKPELFPSTGQVAFGRIEVVLSGPTSRWYPPAVGFLEITNRHSGDRYRISVHADKSLFVVSLAPGDYELTRVEITEGAFRGLAQITYPFSIAKTEQATYLGTWKFLVSSPFYYRTLSLTVVSELTNTIDEIEESYSLKIINPVLSDLPQKLVMETRLFEVMPYPRVKYFRRHPAL
jgi:hypothetical protein